MKKAVFVLFLLVVLLLAFVFMPAEWRLWNDKAEPLPAIKNEEIVFIEAFIYDKNKCRIIGDDLDKVVEYLSNAEPTRIPSETDFVYSENYRGINIKTEEKSYHYFVYKDGRKTYLEIPYVGVYRVDAELFELLDDYLNR